MANAIPAQNIPELLRMRLAASPGRRLPWAEVMRLALYEPGLGYYRRGARPVGREGDFFTSVSVGPLFGRLLAGFTLQVWEAMGRPASFTLIEQGAHDGSLACDLLKAAADLDGAFSAALALVLVEPDPLLREAQAGKLAAIPRVTWVPTLGSLAPTGAGLFLCNELLDAFPAHRLRWTGEAWRELYVTQSGADLSSFSFVEGPLSEPRLEKRTALLGSTRSPGSLVDICLDTEKWIVELAEAPFIGAVLVLDYGMPWEECFAPERSGGSLRRYHRHRMDDRVLEDLGEADLTTDVNFSELASVAESLGLELALFVEQGRFLTRLFAESQPSHPIPMDDATRRQFHTLTHPGLMGRSFHALMLAKCTTAAKFATPTDQEAARRRLGL